MGSSWALVCATALVFVLLSSASEDGQIEQREVTLDELDGLMQKEIDWRDFVGQVHMFPPRRDSFFGPRSHIPPLDYDVEFPLGQPTFDNLQAICLHGDHRPRYPKSYFPDSGFGKQKRMADAVNNAESWFSTCCSRNQTWDQDVILCCATQAWELSVDLFCEEDSSVKNRVYHCCNLRGSQRKSCFKNAAKNKDYRPTEELPVTPVRPTIEFFFDPDSCQGTAMTPLDVTFYRTKKVRKPSTPQKTDINFPPGRPTADNIESVCQNQKLRPLYNVKCLPGSSHNVLALKAKAINRIEKGFKKCCKKKQGVLNCADKKWREEMNMFCMVNRGEQVGQCCMDDRYSCFQSISPDPHYNKTSAAKELSLNNICDTHRIIKKRFAVTAPEFPLETMVKRCCPLPEQDRTSCSAEQVKKLSTLTCMTQISSPALMDCCKMPLQAMSQCFSDLLMDAITEASNTLRQKKRKICPLS